MADGTGAPAAAPAFTPAQLAQIAGQTPEEWIKLAYDSVPPGVTDPAEQSNFARTLLKSLRRPGDPDLAQFNATYGVPTIPGADSFVNLAYAEHYAYARYVVAKTGDIKGEKALIYGYEANKVLKFATKKSDDLKIGEYKPSPPSMDAVKYGEKGAEDGLKDFQKKNPDKFVPFGDAVRGNEELAGKQTGIPPDLIKNTLDTSAKVQTATDQAIKGLQAKAGKLLSAGKKILDNAKKALDAEVKRLKDFKPSDVGEVSEPCKTEPEPQVETSVSGKIISGGKGK